MTKKKKPVKSRPAPKPKKKVAPKKPVPKPKKKQVKAEKKAAEQEIPLEVPAVTGFVTKIINLDDDALREFQATKKEFEEKIGRSLSDAAFTKVLVAIYRVASKTQK